MNEIRLGDFLNEYTCDIPEITKDGMIYKLTYSSNQTEISFYVRFTKLIPYNDVITFEKRLENIFHLDRINLHCSYSPELFTMDYYGELISKLKRKLAVVNGFLDNADVKYGDGLITIGIKNGGYDLLMKANFCNELSKLIKDEFNLDIKTELTGEHSVDVGEHDKMMEEIRASLPKRPEPTAFAPSASAAPPVERKPQEARRADMSGLNLPFDIISDSALQIKGKNIRTQPEPIGEAVKELDRKVTII